jgi:putative ABC transport system substrate-binding protein
MTARRPVVNTLVARRGFIGGIAGTLLVSPRVVRAQGRVYRIGFLGTASREPMAPYFKAFAEGLRELGYVEGRNVVIEHRYADLDLKRYPALAAELVRVPVDVIVVGAPPGIRAAMQATPTIPIVMVVPGDPVGAGFVASLRRPGGNVTGLSSDASPDRVGKNLALLREVAPTASRVAVLTAPAAFGDMRLKVLEEAARRLGVTLRPIQVQGPGDLATAFDTMTKGGDRAVYARGTSFNIVLRREIADLAVKHRMPSVYDMREFVEAGGLMAYGVSVPALYRRAATYVDRIVRGARPGELPVEEPTIYEFVINLKTARSLGLTVPPALLQQADEVIQ